MNLKSLVGVVLISLAACANVPTETFSLINSEEAFRSTIVGKTLVLDNASVKISEDGSLSGTAGGGDFKGMWRFNGGFFCRDLDNSGSFPTNNCQKVEVAGNLARFTANQGAGTVRVWEIR